MQDRPPEALMSAVNSARFRQIMRGIPDGWKEAGYVHVNNKLYIALEAENHRSRAT